MWGLMNTMAGAVRHRVMPRRKSGMGTMTALFVGASVGIAAWEAVRKSQLGSRTMGAMKPTQGGAASDIAEDIMKEIES